MTRFATFGMVAVALLTSAGCGSSGSGHKAAAHPSPARSVKIVALGDSDATGIGDESGKGWVGRYGDLLQRKLGVRVTVDNEAAEGKTSDQLRRDVAGDPSLRQALGHADVVLIGIGGADLNAGDDALSAGSCKGRQCYTQILQAFDMNISAIAREVRRLAPMALLRAMSLPNVFPGAGDAIPPSATADIADIADLTLYQVMGERASVCRAMQSNRGRCVDVVRAFNGTNGSGDAYSTGLMTRDPCCYPSGKGQQLIAELLVASGVERLSRK